MNEESIFATALEKKTAPERQAFLDQACAGNVGLRAQVEELLEADSAAGSFFDRSPVAFEATVVAELSSRDTIDDGMWTGGLAFLDPCDKPDRIGKLDAYEIMEVVGHGGMGVVLRAFDTKLSRVVAIKVMSPTLAANPTAVKRFLREATTAAAVHHEHVVTIHAVDDTHQPPYLVMEFVQGQTLQQKIDREGALELPQILRVASQAAAGLAAAHKLGLIHRDVKPANILLENGVERVKITDFGLARAADDVQMTQTGIVAGTPQYMSPEQARGEPLDARSDLFSFGSVLYTMCTGRSAFRADNPVAVLRRVCDEPPLPIRELNPGIPDWLEAIVNKLLAKVAADRFQTATEVAELLSQHLAHVQNPALVPRPVPIAAPAKPVELPRSRFGSVVGRTSRFHGTAIAAAVTLATLLLLFAISEASGVTNLAATVIRIATGEGTLVIEADDPGVKVVINGEEVVIQGAGMEEVRLRPGSYKIAASKDGKPVAVDQELVTITRGGKQLVRVALDRSAPDRSKLDQVKAESDAVWTPPQKPSPHEILQQAKADRQARQYEVALAKHVWYHENALKYEPSQTGVRLSFALSDWNELANVYPPALAKLKAIRDDDVARVKEGNGDWQLVQDLAAINRQLGQDKSTRDVFVFLHTQNPALAKRVYGVSQSALLKTKEFKLAGQYLDDSSEAFNRMANMFRHNLGLANDKRFGSHMLDYAKSSFTKEITTLTALLVVNGRKTEAEKVAEYATKEWNDKAFQDELKDAWFHAELQKALQGTVPGVGLAASAEAEQP